MTASGRSVNGFHTRPELSTRTHAEERHDEKSDINTSMGSEHMLVIGEGQMHLLNHHLTWTEGELVTRNSGSGSDVGRPHKTPPAHHPSIVQETQSTDIMSDVDDDETTESICRMAPSEDDEPSATRHMIHSGRAMSSSWFPNMACDT